MKKKDPKEQFSYDESANQQVSQQIMDSYTSGVMGTDTGQYGTVENEQYED
ncbi:hypothetical protein [Bacillus sp. KH172YL63]|uniref:hypothetical protein n=1 Tax=Bacillus sp. KH172YL63 TaxID=2709784 RepID=UPI0013E516D8|nr:hypothetical protein [Bacillus sp. KH172YL63]BCB05240.1 hypothetical protein KH172YL63_33730 [Bacillus sp. KH172YL63]